MRAADLALVLSPLPPPGAAVPVGEGVGFFGNSSGSEGMRRITVLALSQDGLVMRRFKVQPLLSVPLRAAECAVGFLRLSLYDTGDEGVL